MHLQNNYGALFSFLQHTFLSAESFQEIYLSYLAKWQLKKACVRSHTTTSVINQSPEQEVEVAAVKKHTCQQNIMDSTKQDLELTSKFHSRGYGLGKGLCDRSRTFAQQLNLPRISRNRVEKNLAVAPADIGSLSCHLSGLFMFYMFLIYKTFRWCKMCFIKNMESWMMDTIISCSRVQVPCSGCTYEKAMFKTLPCSTIMIFNNLEHPQNIQRTSL